jgi:DNA replication protein DnaC
VASATEVKARLIECLRELHLPTFREGFEDLARRAVQESFSYEQYLGELADQECQARRINRIERWLRESDLPLDKSLSRFNMKRLPAKVARQARTLLDGAFVDARENVLAFGRSGSGKTHLLCGIAQELVRSGRKCYQSGKESQSRSFGESHQSRRRSWRLLLNRISKAVSFLVLFPRRR